MLKFQTIHINHTDGELIKDKSLSEDSLNTVQIKDFFKYEEKERSVIVNLHTIDILYISDNHPRFKIDTISIFKPFEFPCDASTFEQLVFAHLSHKEVIISESLVKNQLPEKFLFFDEPLFLNRVYTLLSLQNSFLTANPNLAPFP